MCETHHLAMRQQLHDCGSLEEEEEPLEAEWGLLKEPKRNFEREREKGRTSQGLPFAKADSGYCAARLKSQFLNLTALTDCRCSSSDGRRAFSIRSQPEKRMSSDNSKQDVFSTSKPLQCLTVLSTEQLHRNLCFSFCSELICPQDEALGSFHVLRVKAHRL